MSARTPYLRIERRIASSEHGGIVERWRYGRELLTAKTGRKQLPHGLTADLIKAATKAGLKLSEQEIQRRIRCAEAYPTEAEVRHTMTDFGTWFDLIQAGFPPVAKPVQPEDFAELGVKALTDEATSGVQLTLTLPGLPDELKTKDGRKVPTAEATVADAITYRDTFREMHENFGKTLAVVEATVHALVEACDGYLSMTIAEAWTGDEPEPEPATP